MANFHFIQDPQALAIIQSILELAGPNFNPPYDQDSQPSNASDRNNETLIQYQLPAGSEIKGYAEPSVSRDMGSAINSMLAALAPFISAYSMILPILGIIRGIIEIMCAMNNPFDIIDAVIRLFVKWVPPFISLYPPFAGVVILLSTIKTILAVVFYVLTEIVVTLQLIIDNIRTLAKAFGPNSNEQTREAAIQKLQKLNQDLANRLGVFNVLLPLLEIIFSILGLVTGFPCSGGKRSDCSRGSLPRGGDESFPCDDESDTTTNCPDVIKNPPTGSAILMPSFFGDSIPFFAYRVVTVTGNERLSEIVPFMQDTKSQLDNQLDEPIDVASPFGSDGNTAHFNLKITDKRGRETEAPIAGIRGNVIVTVDPELESRIGNVTYEIVPNFPMLISRDIIGVACHPDVESVIQQAQNRAGNTELTAIDKNPEAASLLEDTTEVNEDITGTLNNINNIINEVSESTPDPDFEDFVDRVQSEQDNITDRLTNFSNGLKNIMNSILSRSTDKISTEFDIDKNLVRANGQDSALITVIPRDFTGSPIAKNLPEGVDVSIDLFTDFGNISNQQRNNATGEITAEITSAFPGTALITAKVNGEFVTIFDGEQENIRELEVRFITDSVLPKRRKVSTGTPTGSNSEFEPGRR